MKVAQVAERLHRVEVHEATTVGSPDLPGEWAVLAFREDSHGCFVRSTYYPSRDGAIIAAQQMRQNERPGCGLAVYCPRCHARCSHLFGYWVCACSQEVTDA